MKTTTKKMEGANQMNNLHQCLLVVVVLLCVTVLQNAYAGDLKHVFLNSCRNDTPTCLRISAPEGAVSRLQTRLSVLINATVEWRKNGKVTRWQSPRVVMDLKNDQVIVEAGPKQTADFIFNLRDLEVSKVAL